LGLSHALDANAYLIVHAGQATLIDSGAGPWIVETVERLLTSLQLKGPSRLLLTHGHADHSGGAAALKERWPKLEVYAGAALIERMSRDDDPVSLERARAAGVYPADYRFALPVVDRALVGGEWFPLGEVRISVLATPGHTSEHVVFHVAGGTDTLLFTGDHVFTGGYVSVEPIPTCDVMAYAESMRQLAQVSYDGLLPGHLGPRLDDQGRSVRRAVEYFGMLRMPPDLGNVLR
jgi:glyoxylase-like metal-dependent hydrolase (beta-lactamase superfamily II)